jgi:cytochrome P450
MQAAARRHLEQWPADRAFPLQPAFAALTMDIIVETVIGVRERGRREELCARLTRLLSLGTHPGLFFFIGRSGSVRLSGFQKALGPLSPLGLFLQRKRAVTALFHEEIARRRKEPSPTKDVLSLLLDLSDEELHDELMTLLVAGHETTATALAWTMHRLAGHPDVLGRAIVEARDTEETRYLEAVILETMRLHPVVPMVVRQLAEPKSVAGRSLPAGIVLAPNIWLAHRRPDVWPDPERFDPARFLGDNPRPQHFFPFGGGNRTCVGRVFALLEMRIVLREILRGAGRSRSPATSRAWSAAASPSHPRAACRCASTVPEHQTRRVAVVPAAGSSRVSVRAGDSPENRSRTASAPAGWKTRSPRWKRLRGALSTRFTVSCPGIPPPLRRSTSKASFGFEPNV